VGNPLADRSVTWSSTDTLVASVSATGLVRGHGVGAAVVLALSDGARDSVAVTVRLVPVAAVQIAPGAVSLLVGQTRQLTATPVDSLGAPLAGRAVTWASSDSSVAAISDAGLATARGAGTATLTASSEGRVGSVTATVRLVPAAAVRLASDSIDVVVGTRRALAATVHDSAGGRLTGRAVAWSTSDATVASIDAAGTLVALRPGAAAVTATSEGQSATGRVVVRAVPVVSVAVAPRQATLVPGATRTFTAEPRDSAGAALPGRTVAWSSANPSVATVTGAGVVTAVSPGDAVIVAVSEGVRDSARVAVVRPGAADDTVVVVTFGDSNTDIGWSGSDRTRIASSYISLESTRIPAAAPHHPTQLAYKIEHAWRAASATPIVAVNHAIGGTSTGGGAGGGPNRTWTGDAPNARTEVGGVTRFEGEVLGRAYPWSGGEPVNAQFPEGAIRRAHARAAHANSFAYVSMGTNDRAYDMAPSLTVANVEWMIATWVASGQRADHFILTTLPPRVGNDFPTVIPELNDAFRAIARRTGVGLVDIAARVSDDNGRSWRSRELEVGDGLHYSESVRDWVAAAVVAYVRDRVAAR
jgi:uncharacterized protein YjdB